MLLKNPFLLLLMIFLLGCASEPNNKDLQQKNVNDGNATQNENGEENPIYDSTLVQETVVEHDLETNKSDSLDSIQLIEAPQLKDFHEYIDLSNFLGIHVSNSGKVNYKAIAKQKDQLNGIIVEFQSNFPRSDWTKDQEVSYWINLYNIATIKLIVDNYPLTSIKEIAAKPWDIKFISVDNKKVSLNNIEHGIIRKIYNNPKVHFALNCASESCPILLNRAYRPSVLTTQLNAQTKKFLYDSSKNDFSDSNIIRISQIFDWYKDDFTKSGTLIEFLNKNLTDKLDTPEIEYLDYSWSLNQ